MAPLWRFLYICPVLSRQDVPFPFEAVRDLLGVVRALYAAAKDGGAPRPELARIAKIGGELSRALDLAGAAGLGTLGHAAAWKRAEDATQRAGELVDALTPAEPLVSAACARVSGVRLALRKKGPER